MNKIDFTGSWGGITLANGYSLVPNQETGELYLQPPTEGPTTLDEKLTQSEYETRYHAWCEKLKQEQIPVEHLIVY